MTDLYSTSIIKNIYKKPSKKSKKTPKKIKIAAIYIKLFNVKNCPKDGY